jgi:hypothetical protein
MTSVKCLKLCYIGVAYESVCKGEGQLRDLDGTNRPTLLYARHESTERLTKVHYIILSQ